MRFLGAEAIQGRTSGADAPDRHAVRCKTKGSNALSSATIGNRFSMDASNESGRCSLSTFYYDPSKKLPVAFWTIMVASEPVRGRLSLRQGASHSMVGYVPTANYTGEDRFSLRAEPGNGEYVVVAQIGP